MKETLEKEFPKVERLSGKGRYETNLKILEAADVAGGEIIVATGENFADSLSASAVRRPILLVKDTLSDAQKEFLGGLEEAKFYIAGGTGAVSDKLKAELEDYTKAEIERLSGKSRKDTSVEIAKKFFKNPTAAIVASSENYPDGLCGGPLAAELNVPLILTFNGDYVRAREYVDEGGIDAGYVLGGSGVLLNETVVEVYGLNSPDDIK